MNKTYASNKLSKFYNDRRFHQRKYGKNVADGLHELLDAIDAATCAYDIKVMPYYWMHELHHNREGQYSLSVDNKKTKWRLIVKCIDDNNNWVKPGEDEISFLKSIKTFELGEFSDHYD